MLSSFITSSGIAEKIGKFLNPVSSFIFGLPGICAGGIVMGFIGGYPTGAKMVSELHQSGYINDRQGRHMMYFCVNAGPAFVISAVGYYMLGSKKAGLLIFLSIAAASFVLGVIMRFFIHPGGTKEKKIEREIKRINIADAFVESTANASAAMFSICAWVLVFQSLTSCLGFLSLPKGLKAVTGSLLEVTSGVADCIGMVSVPIVCSMLAFGGFSVHFQIIKYITEIGMKYSEFLFARLLNAVLAYLICKLLFAVFPCDIQTFSNGIEAIANPVSVSIPAAIALVLMCGIFLIERKTKY